MFELIQGKVKRCKLTKNKLQLVDAIVEILNVDLRDYLPVTVRQVHYNLLNYQPLRHTGKPQSTYVNDKASYQECSKILNIMRIDGMIPGEFIIDETRPVELFTSNYQNSRELIQNDLRDFFRGYKRDYLQSQPHHIEVVAEKLTVKRVIDKISRYYCTPYTITRGYCSYPVKMDLVNRYKKSGKDNLILIFVSDFDPDGLEIQQSFARSIRDDFKIDESKIKIYRAGLMLEQIRELRAGGVEIQTNFAKPDASKFKEFMKLYGKEVYELEAIPPATLETFLENAIKSVIDKNLFNQEIEIEARERKELEALREKVIEALPHDLIA